MWALNVSFLCEFELSVLILSVGIGSTLEMCG